MLVSNGCHCKVRQTGWLKITDIYSLAVLETRTPDQGVMFPPKSQENNPSLSVLASGGCWQPLLFLMHVCVSISKCLCSYKDTSHIKFRAHPNSVWSHGTWLLMQRRYFLTFWGSQWKWILRQCYQHSTVWEGIRRGLEGQVFCRISMCITFIINFHK